MASSSSCFLDPVSRLLSKQGFVVLDGGLGTDLESLGYDISSLSCIWGAHFLQESPEVIAQVHKRFFDAGADIAITSSYQASFDGFKTEGIEEKKGVELLQLSVKVAVEARDKWWENYISKTRAQQQQDGVARIGLPRQKPLVAGSIGPYGASLPGAQEYVGNYKAPACSCKHTSAFSCSSNSSDYDETSGGVGDTVGEEVYMTVEQLHDWHLYRLEVIGKSEGVDILAIETIPSFTEAKALVGCLNEMYMKHSGNFPKAWICFSCKDGEHINDGTLLSEVLEELAVLDTNNCLIGFGVNCTDFKHILKRSNTASATDAAVAETSSSCTPPFLPHYEGLLTVLEKHRKGRHVVVYPNSGEKYDGITKEWHDEDSNGFMNQFARDVVLWKEYLNNTGKEKVSKDVQLTGEGEDRQDTNSQPDNSNVEISLCYNDSLPCYLCVGGCCRIGPNDITKLRAALEESQQN